MVERFVLCTSVQPNAVFELAKVTIKDSDAVDHEFYLFPEQLIKHDGATFVKAATSAKDKNSVTIRLEVAGEGRVEIDVPKEATRRWLS